MQEDIIANIKKKDKLTLYTCVNFSRYIEIVLLVVTCFYDFELVNFYLAMHFKFEIKKTAAKTSKLLINCIITRTIKRVGSFNNIALKISTNYTPRLKKANMDKNRV